jgi:hypothetical protein
LLSLFLADQEARFGPPLQDLRIPRVSKMSADNLR